MPTTVTTMLANHAKNMANPPIWNTSLPEWAVSAAPKANCIRMYVTKKRTVR